MSTILLVLVSVLLIFATLMLVGVLAIDRRLERAESRLEVLTTYLKGESKELL